MTALYLLAQEHRALADRLADMEIDPQTLADTLEGEALPLEQKAIAVAMVARNFEALAASIKEAVKDMQDRAKAADKRAEALRAYLLQSMVFAGIKQAESPQLCVSVKGKAAALEVFDEAQVPAEFFDQPEPPPPKLSKVRIGAAIKAGREVPGAKFGNDIYRLEIK
jgi:hypothetical protein